MKTSTTSSTRFWMKIFSTCCSEAHTSSLVISLMVLPMLFGLPFRHLNITISIYPLSCYIFCFKLISFLLVQITYLIRSLFSSFYSFFCCSFTNHFNIRLIAGCRLFQHLVLTLVHSLIRLINYRFSNQIDIFYNFIVHSSIYPIHGSFIHSLFVSLFQLLWCYTSKS